MSNSSGEPVQSGSAQTTSWSSSDSEQRRAREAQTDGLPLAVLNGDFGPAPTGRPVGLLTGAKLSCRAVPLEPVLVSVLEKQVSAAAALRRHWEAKVMQPSPLPLPGELFVLILKFLSLASLEETDLRPHLMTLRAMGRACRSLCLIMASVIAQLPVEFRRKAAHFELPLLQEAIIPDSNGQDLGLWTENFLAARWGLEQDKPLPRLRCVINDAGWLAPATLPARSFDPVPEEIDLRALDGKSLIEWEQFVRKYGDRVQGLCIADSVPGREQERRQVRCLALCRNLSRLTIGSWGGAKERGDYSWINALADLRELSIDSRRWPPIAPAVFRQLRRLSLGRAQWDDLCSEPGMLDCFAQLKALTLLADAVQGQPLHLPPGLTQLSVRSVVDILADGAPPLPAGLTELKIHYGPGDEKRERYLALLRKLDSHSCPPNAVLYRFLQSEDCRLRRLHVHHASNEERKLFTALAGNRSLTELQLDPIYLISAQVGPLVEFLRGQPALQVLRLAFPVRRMWLEQLQDLIDAIATHPGLRVVSLDFDKLQSSLHHFEDGIEQQLCMLPRRNPGLMELDVKLRPRDRGLLTFRFLRRAYLRDEPAAVEGQ